MYFKKCDIFEWICEAYDLIEEANSGVYGELDEDEDQFFNFKISIEKIFEDETSVESLYKVLEKNINRIDLFFDQLIKFKSKIKGNISNQEINFSDNQITVS
ncbi:hypothetical protein ACTFIT_008588 [Dictyostelium discoideum]